MSQHHREVFNGHNPTSVAVVFLPAMGRLDSPGNLPLWTEGADAGHFGLWLNDDDDEAYFWPERSQHAEV